MSVVFLDQADLLDSTVDVVSSGVQRCSGLKISRVTWLGGNNGCSSLTVSRVALLNIGPCVSGEAVGC